MSVRDTLPVLPEGYTITRAALWDLPAIRQFERLIFPQDSYTYLDLLLLMISGMTNLKLVGPGGELVGFVSGGRLFWMGRTWIMTIGIHPQHRRRGLGRILLETCEQRLADREIYLTVRESNRRAKRIYEVAGYRPVLLKPAYYPGGEAGIEMRKVR